MTKIFISGSRSITKLTDYCKSVIDKIKTNNYTVLLGDCYGVDTLIQKELINYPNVLIYHIGSKPRNNIGNHKTKQILGNRYIDKDISMADDCDIGFVLWDGISKGSKANIERLEKMGKECYYKIINS